LELFYGISSTDCFCKTIFYIPRSYGKVNNQIDFPDRYVQITLFGMISFLVSNFNTTLQQIFIFLKKLLGRKS